MTAIAEAALPLVDELDRLEARVQRAVAVRRGADPTPEDPFRGLYLSDAHLDWLFGQGPPQRGTDPDRDADVVVPPDGPLSELVERFGLSALEADLLVCALAPDVDARFAAFFGYLNDDVSRRRATVSLVLELTGRSPFDAEARAVFAPGAPLDRFRLVRVTDETLPFPQRELRVPDRVTDFLLGGDRPATKLAPFLLGPPPVAADGSAVARVLAAGAPLVYVQDRPGAATRSFADDASRRSGKRALHFALEAVDARDLEVYEAMVRIAGREAVLQDAILVAGPVDDRPAAIFGELGCPVILFGRTPLRASWPDRSAVTFDAPVPDASTRAALWRDALGDDLGDVAAAELAAFALRPESVMQAAECGRLLAAAAGRDPSPADVVAGARAQNAVGLDRLARHIEPAVSWDDLVVPDAVRNQLLDLTARVRHRGQVLDQWRMRPGGGRGRGIVGLFAGDPGTGKTMSAEAVAAQLGFDLYAVNLATVVDKYIGETEKNLERIFDEADGVNGVILFDEADALFGKRSDVSDAHDRHANLEVAYLLQRLESFDGLAILSTNLRGNLDPAFARRLDVIIDFPMPDVARRAALWESCLRPPLPRGDDVDVEFCARAFELSGGSIRSICVTAAYLSAEAGEPVRMAHLLAGVVSEYRKLGRLVTESEFGPHYPTVAALLGRVA